MLIYFFSGHEKPYFIIMTNLLKKQLIVAMHISAVSNFLVSINWSDPNKGKGGKKMNKCTM